jgi:hypothetical protein
MMRISAIVSALILAGCGANGPSSTQACGDLAKARCARYAACSNGSYVTRTYGDMSTCITREALSCTLGEAAPQTGGSPAAAEQCAAALATQSCADLFANNPPAECVNKGLRGVGITCAFAGQCASTYCLNARTSLCGTCGDAPPSGISCAHEQCARGEICTARTMTCQKPVQLGEPCDNTTLLCAADLGCLIPSGASTGTCTSTVATVGAPCGPMVGSCDGTLGLTCSNRKCVTISYAGDGTACGNFTVGGFGSCGAGGNCYTASGIAQVGEMGVCKAAAADGKPCDITLGPPCLTPARCNVTGGGSAGICTLPSGSACG